VAPAAGGALPGGFSPGQIRTAYGFDQITFSNGTILGDGSGQTIAIIDAYDQPNIASDLAAFDATYGIADPPHFTKVNENGGSSYPAADTNWGLEISLDVEWAHAIAPGANILLVEASSSGWSDLITAINYARNQAGVSVVSMSWGSGEWSGETAYDSTYTTPTGHGGVTFVASTGDSGSSGAPEAPSASPNVLAVGGTQLSTDSLGNYLSETGWSGSGGGISAYEAQPGYQKGVVTQSTAQRAVPDVAYNGSSASPFAVYDTSGYGGWIQVYGTSAGAPQWAALIAIANQGRALAGKAALDGPTQTVPGLYQLPSTDFRDITTGSNGGYSAGVGYDLVTGLGTPLANRVVADLVGATNTSPPTNQPPVVVAAASASPAVVTGTTTHLSVLGNDDGGAANLTYTWSLTTAPAFVPTPRFSANGTNAAQNTTATFFGAGVYTFQVAITDASGLSVSSSVTVQVYQNVTSVSVTPGSASLSDGATKQFAATALDQFGNAMATQPAFTWSIAGMGGVDSNGLYSAPVLGTTTDTVMASASAMTGAATVTVGTVPAAPTNLMATVVNSRQVSLAWTDNSNNETGFIIQRSTNGGGWVQIANVGANGTAYTDKTVHKGSTYIYRIYATNSFGNSAYSNSTSPITPHANIAGPGATQRTDAVLVAAAAPPTASRGWSFGKGSAAPASDRTLAPSAANLPTVTAPSTRLSSPPLAARRNTPPRDPSSLVGADDLESQDGLLPTK
jgi:subtilase family serine protease